MQKKVFFKNWNCRIWPDNSMGICGKKFRIFDRIDFKILAFEGRKKCFFGPCLARSLAFDSRWRQNLESYKAELLEIHNVWNVRYLR
jgi:hypothetical protein